MIGLWILAACGGAKPDEPPAPQPTAPLPTTRLAGQPVLLLPLTLVAAEEALGWDEGFADRRGTLARGDSVIASLLPGRTPEVSWVLPAALRRAARRAVGVATDPDQLGTAVLRADGLTLVPDPLRSQLRTLAALAGGRFALVPAALVYRRSAGQAVGRPVTPQTPPTAGPPDRRTALAELSVVLVDVRLGRVGWRTVARGDGEDPWSALTRAVKSLTPGLP